VFSKKSWGGQAGATQRGGEKIRRSSKKKKNRKTDQGGGKSFLGGGKGHQQLHDQPLLKDFKGEKGEKKGEGTQGSIEGHKKGKKKQFRNCKRIQRPPDLMDWGNRKKNCTQGKGEGKCTNRGGGVGIISVKVPKKNIVKRKNGATEEDQKTSTPASRNGHKTLRV